MTSQANAESQHSEPDASQVHDYLANHAEFFNEYPDALPVVRARPAVQVLREQNHDLKQRLMELVDVARDNDRLNERLHNLTLELIGAGSLTELVESLEHQLRNEFMADAIILHLPELDESRQRETGAQPLVIDDQLRELLPTPLTENKPQCGRLKQAQAEFLFGEQAAAIESSAVIPLGENACGGLLTIGSREVNRFNPCMGTVFLMHLGELLVRLLDSQSPA